MKLRVFILLLIAGFSFFLQGCKDEKGVYELFSGTLPRIEIPDGEESSYTEAQTLFFTLKGNVVELEGEVYPIELISDDEESTSYSTSIPLTSDIHVSGLSYLKAEEKLVLDIAGLERRLVLEKFAHLMDRKANEFAEVELTSDLSHLSDNQREMIGLLFQVADIMEDIYWAQVFPDRDAALASMMDPNVVRFFKINYGPWERLNGNLPYLTGFGPKPAGSGFYPADMTKEEFDALDDPQKTSLYTLITRDQDGSLKVIPYHEAFSKQVQEAAELLRQASEGISEVPGAKVRSASERRLLPFRFGMDGHEGKRH